jgi:hypothetical protein
MSSISLKYFLAASEAYKKLHDLPFVGNEDYWTGRIYAYHLMDQLHQLEKTFKALHNKSELPLDVYMDLNSRLIISKSKIRRWLASIPSLDKEYDIERSVDVFEKIEKISEIKDL